MNYDIFFVSAHLRLVSRWFTGTEPPTRNSHIFPLFSWHRTWMIKLSEWLRDNWANRGAVFTSTVSHVTRARRLSLSKIGSSFGCVIGHNCGIGWQPMLVLEFVRKPMEEIGNAVLVLRGVAAGINHCLAFQNFPRANWCVKTKTTFTRWDPSVLEDLPFDETVISRWGFALVLPSLELLEIAGCFKTYQKSPYGGVVTLETPGNLPMTDRHFLLTTHLPALFKSIQFATHDKCYNYCNVFN